MMNRYRISLVAAQNRYRRQAFIVLLASLFVTWPTILFWCFPHNPSIEFAALIIASVLYSVVHVMGVFGISHWVFPQIDYPAFATLLPLVRRQMRRQQLLLFWCWLPCVWSFLMLLSCQHFGRQQNIFTILLVLSFIVVPLQMLLLAFLPHLYPKHPTQHNRQRLLLNSDESRHTYREYLKRLDFSHHHQPSFGEPGHPETYYYFYQ